MTQSAAGSSSATSAAAAKPTKATPPKTSASKLATKQASQKLAVAKTKQPGKAASVSKKSRGAKKIAIAAKKPTSSTKIAAATPKPVAPPAASAGSRVAAASSTPTPPVEAKTAITPISLSLTVDAPRPAEPPAAAAKSVAEPKTAATFVSTFLSEAFRIAKLADANSLQRRAKLAELFADKIDMKRIAGYTAADALTGKSADIEQHFRTILVSYLVETYYPQLELASDPGVRVDTAPAEPLADGTAVVWTTFTKDGWGSQSVKFHVAAEAGHYKVIDIFTAGASLVQMERDTFRSVMRDGGLTTLMAKLDARTRELASAATE
jgi:ABC-type transporter MlaC component